MASKCPRCGNPLNTAEDKLLAAIFSHCRKCYETVDAPKCKICGENTELKYNGEPRCPEHMGY